MVLACSSERGWGNGALEDEGKGEEDVVALFVHSGEIGTDDAQCIETLLGAIAAGDFLFNLGHAHGLLGDVVGERDAVI